MGSSRAYDLRHMIFGFPEASSKASKSLNGQSSSLDHNDNLPSERIAAVSSRWHFEAVASFQSIWWNQGSNSRKKLSIWRPVIPQGMIYFGDIAVKGYVTLILHLFSLAPSSYIFNVQLSVLFECRYEPPNSCVVLHDTGDEVFRAPLDFQLVGQIKKQRGVDGISFWMPQAPAGFVSLGCVACKGTPKKNDFSRLRCLRSDMVTGDQFSEESVWVSSDYRHVSGPFSIWTVGNELGTFIVRSGFKKPPRRFALKLADSSVPIGSDDTAIEAEIKTFSAALFDDYGGLVRIFHSKEIHILLGKF